MDIWGPALVSSIGVRSYFMTFIDSRKVSVYFIRHKLEVFDVVKRWKAVEDNKINMKVKKLWCDNGGEYENSKFKSFVIKMELNKRRLCQ